MQLILEAHDTLFRVWELAVSFLGLPPLPLVPAGTSQFGLVAEDVEKVNPDLVARDKEGKPYSVRYHQVNAMLLNEFLKEHCKVENLDATVGQLKSDRAHQETAISDLKNEVHALTAQLKEQAAQIQKVSVQLEASKSVPRAANNS